MKEGKDVNINTKWYQIPLMKEGKDINMKYIIVTKECCKKKSYI